MKKISMLFMFLLLVLSCTNNVDELVNSNVPSEYNGEEIHVCTEMTLPDELQDSATRLGVFKTSKWIAGDQITVKFLNGDNFLQEKVKQYANEWSVYANIRFIWVSSSSNAQIRVAFKWKDEKGKEDTGSWSYVGKEALSVPQSKPTVNFGWFNSTTSDQEFSRTVTHEFGHVLGLIHEHQHPKCGIQWNKPYVYSYYEAQGWNKATVDLNVFSKYTTSQLNDFNYDQYSIMHYEIPANFTLNNSGNTPFNTVLSSADKAYIAEVYPYPANGAYNYFMGYPYIVSWLKQFDYLQSQNGKYRLYFQPDGNLKLYRVASGVVQYQIWSTNIGNKPYALYAVIENGNLQIVDDLGGERTVYWSTNASYPTPAPPFGQRQVKFILQDDGDLVLCDSPFLNSNIVWRSKTAGK